MAVLQLLLSFTNSSPRHILSPICNLSLGLCSQHQSSIHGCVPHVLPYCPLNWGNFNSHDLERKALESLQTVLTEVKAAEEIDAAFDASSLSIVGQSGQYLKSLMANCFGGGLMTMGAQLPIASMVMVLREPWVDTNQMADGSIHIDPSGHPPLPSKKIVYGQRFSVTGNGQPITTFREARLLHSIQEQEMNNGSKFEPSTAFFEKRDANTELSLIVDSD